MRIAIALKECERLGPRAIRREAVAHNSKAIIDAREYSDQLIARSKQEAKRIDDATAKTVDTVSQKINELETDISKTARQFATAFNALLDELEELKESLGGINKPDEIEGQKSIDAVKDNIFDISKSL